MCKFFKIACLIPVLYILLCCEIYAFPELFFYKASLTPGNLEKVRSTGFMVEDVVYRHSDEGPVHGWLYRNDTEKNNGKIILFFHGNAYNLEWYYHKLVPLAEAGYSVFMPEYRGFGGHGYKIRQKNLEEDTLYAFQYVRQLGFENSDIILYGMSLGSHQALYSAAKVDHKDSLNAVILEVPFLSLSETAKYHVTFFEIPWLPLDFLLTDKYNNESLIKEVATRVLVMTTENDRLIPPEQAKKLFEMAHEPKKLVVFEEGSHSDLYKLKNYLNILEWLEQS